MAQNNTAKSGNGATDKKSQLGFEADLVRAADKPKLQPLFGEIGWAKNLLTIARCEGEPEATIRKFRIVQTEAN